MNGKISIIMYHYVRDLEKSRYPEIKGLNYALFIEQLEYIKKHYYFIKVQDIFNAINTGDCSNIPQNSVLLTFDDGYIDHYTNVFPVLDKYKIQGCFFPPAKAIENNSVLDVNKIHYLLAAVKDKNKIVEKIMVIINNYKKEYKLKDGEFYFKQYAKESRFDSKEVVFIKLMLQKVLPLELRQIALDKLFKQYVTKDEVAFSKELYMDMEQLRCLKRNGMYIGSHGYDHCWLNTLEPKEQEKEINLSLKFLRNIGVNTDAWVMCYPYGGYSDSLLEYLKKNGCKLGLTTQVNIADLANNNFLTLPRLDTNDLPKDRNAKKNKWTLQVI